MPVNDDGVEVNEDGTPITPEQLETSNWENVMKLEDSSKAKALDMEVLAPTCVPHNIPYLEIFRTDELYFKNYESPFLSNSGNTSFEEPTQALGTDSTGTANDKANVVSHNVANELSKGETHSSKTKNSNLASELESILRNHYKSTANFKVLVQRYINAKTNKLSISVVNGRSSNNLKKGTDIKSMTNAILRVKKKYG